MRLANDRRMQPLLAGAVGGMGATAPMTAVMELLHRRLPWYERHALPPRQITHNVARELGIAHRLRREERDVATLVSHFGYGGLAGIAYVLATPRAARRPVVRGMALGLGVWAAGYLGWLPASGLGPAPTDEGPRRAAVMVAAHLVWGAATALLVERLRRREQPAAASPRA
jgi:uncharacterized membrane protein YagU involved in acid resistance